MRRRPSSGFSLLEVLIAVVLLGGVATTFFLFTRNAQKGAANLLKIGETASLDGNIRAVLLNKTSCLETVQHIPGIPTTGGAVAEEDIPGIYGHFDATAAGQPKIYEVGSIQNGMKILEIKASVGEEVRSARLVHIKVKAKKDGASLNDAEATFHYYLNVRMVAGALDSCISTDHGAGKLVLQDSDAVELLSSALAPVAPYPYKRYSMSTGQATDFGYPQWESGVTLAPTATCDYEDPANRCPYYDSAPRTEITAKGNLLVYSFQGKVSMGIKNYPAGAIYSFGAVLAIVVRDENDQVISDDNSIQVSGSFQLGQWRHEALTTPTVALKVVPGKKYRFYQRFSTDHSVPPPGGFYFMNWFPAHGTIFHYTQTSASP